MSREASADTAGPRRVQWVKTAAWFLMLSAALLNLLNFNSYPLLRPEVAAVLMALGAIAIGLAILEGAAPRLAFAFTGLLILIFADLNTEHALIPLALGCAAMAAAWFHNAAVVKISIAAFATVVVFQLGAAVLGPSSVHAAEDKSLARIPSQAAGPPIVHLLMDSYLGTEGMAADPAFRQLRQDTVEFYTSRGFRLYDGAYSRHANTANSVPYILSFGTAEPVRESQVSQRQTPPRFKYFEKLAANNYTISVLGANFIDLCTAQPVDHCRQFEHSELSALTDFPLSTRDRAVSIGITLASFSSLVSTTYDLGQLANWYLGGDTPVVMRNLKKVSPPRSALAMRELERTLAHVEYGSVYFAHLLMPHEPYLFDADCNILPRATWSTEQAPGSVSEREADYRAQLGCTHRLLGRMFNALDSSPAGRNAVVIIHGDHGSRIVRQRPTVEHPSPDPRDFAMTYSTMFAVRAPGITAALTPGRAALDDLLREFAEGNFATAPVAGEGNGEVILATMDWLPKRRVPLPEY